MISLSRRLARAATNYDHEWWAGVAGAELRGAWQLQDHCHWGPGESALSWSPDPLESVLFCDRGDVFSPVKVGSGGIKPSFILFFCFILLFWNQILTWNKRDNENYKIWNHNLNQNLMTFNIYILNKMFISDRKSLVSL